MANKKISEITVKASGGDLPGARYIAAVPDGAGFVTKYVQGFGAGSAGGLIDIASMRTGSPGTHTFPNFDPNTQIVMIQGDTLLMREFPVGTNTIEYSVLNRPVKLSLSASGVASGIDNASNNVDYTFQLARFTKANLGGGGVGRAYGRLVGNGVQNATMQADAFNMTGSHAFSPGGRFSVNTNTYTFNFGSTITNPIPFAIPNNVEASPGGSDNVGAVSVGCTETTCTVVVTGVRGSGCSCLIL